MACTSDCAFQKHTHTLQATCSIGSDASLQGIAERRLDVHTQSIVARRRCRHALALRSPTITAPHPPVRGSGHPGAGCVRRGAAALAPSRCARRLLYRSATQQRRTLREDCLHGCRTPPQRPSATRLLHPASRKCLQIGVDRAADAWVTTQNYAMEAAHSETAVASSGGRPPPFPPRPSAARPAVAFKARVLPKVNACHNAASISVPC